jgi:hypothetical protein
MDEHPETGECTWPELALLARRADVSLTDDDLSALAPKVAHNQAPLGMGVCS